MNPPTISTPDVGVAADRAAAVRMRLPVRALPSGRASGHGSTQVDASLWDSLLGAPRLGAGELAALGAIARVSHASAGSLIFAQGEFAHGLLAVLDGDVALGSRSADGSFRTERHLHGPGWLDASAAWLSEAHSCDARALSSARVLELPCEALSEVADRHPDVWRRLVVVLAREVRGLALNTHDLMHKDAPARLAAWLLQHCVISDATRGTGVVQLPVRKRDIASQLGITPETLSRLMRSFSSQGVITVAGYTVHVLDVSGLQRVAQPV